MIILAIDPGSDASGYVVYDTSSTATRPVIESGKLLNPDMRRLIAKRGWIELMADVVALEWMTPRGMPTSAQEFETLFWIGRYYEVAIRTGIPHVERVSRLSVKVHVTGSAKANDSNIRAALIDRFGGTGGKRVAVGLKSRPGPLYGIGGDAWAALGIAVTVADTFDVPSVPVT